MSTKFLSVFISKYQCLFGIEIWIWLIKKGSSHCISAFRALGVQLLLKISLLCQNTSCARWSHRIHKTRAILSSKYAHTNYLGLQINNVILNVILYCFSLFIIIDILGKVEKIFNSILNTPTRWLRLLLVLGKSRVKQNSC